jgi:hypothetical protein
MAEGQDETRGRIETYPWPPRRGGVEVGAGEPGLHALQPAHRRARRPAAPGRTGRQGAGAVVATGGLGQPGTLGREVMLLDDALEFIATEGFFWIHAS